MQRSCAALTLLLLCPLAVPAASAQPQPTREVTLSETLALFRANNLQLAIARARAAEMNALARQAGAWPNPTAMVTHEPLSNDGISYSETNVNLSQRIEQPGVRRARIRAADWVAKSANADLRADSLLLVFDVVRTFAQAVAAPEIVRVHETAVEVFRRADRSGAAMLEVGEGSGYDLRRIRVERAKYENRLALAELETADAQRRLALLALPETDTTRLVPVGDAWRVPDRPTLAEVLRAASTSRAEIRAARDNVAAERAGLQLARNERLPEPTVTGGYKRQSDSFSGVFLGIALPLPVFDRNTGTIRARDERLHQAETMLTLVERSVQNEARRAYEVYVSLADRYDLIAGDLLGEVDALLNAARVAYAEGEMSVVELLDAAEAWQDARVSAIELRRDLRIAYYDLLRASGGYAPIN